MTVLKLQNMIIKQSVYVKFVTDFVTHTDTINLFDLFQFQIPRTHLKQPIFSMSVY